MKKLLKLLVAVLILCCVPCQAKAESEYQRVNDNANLMSESETASLNELADAESERYQCDIVILSINGTDGESVDNYADIYYSDYGYGYGDKKDGVILVVDMDSRECRMVNTGKAMDVFTGWGINYICDEIKADLSDENYYNAFKTYIDLTTKFLEQAEKGKPYDENNKFETPKTTIDYIVNVLIGFAVSLVITLIIMMVMKSKLKSVDREYAAKNYVAPGSLNVTASRELYLYSTRTMTEKPKDNDNEAKSFTGPSGTDHTSGGTKF